MQGGAQGNHLIRDSKLKAYLQAIRTHPEVRGQRKALSWLSVRQILRDSGQEHYDLDHSSYRKWYDDVEGNAGAEPQDFAQDGLLAAAHSRPKRAKRPNRLYAGGEFDTTID